MSSVVPVGALRSVVGGRGGTQSRCLGRGAAGLAQAPSPRQLQREETRKPRRRRRPDAPNTLTGLIAPKLSSPCGRTATPPSTPTPLHSPLPRRKLISLPGWTLGGRSRPSGCHLRWTPPSWDTTSLLRPHSQSGLSYSQDGPGLSVGCETRQQKGFPICFPNTRDLWQLLGWMPRIPTVGEGRHLPARAGTAGPARPAGALPRPPLPLPRSAPEAVSAPLPLLRLRSLSTHI